MPNLPRLYAILDIDSLTARGLEPRPVFDAWLDAGVRLIQLRAKTMPSGAMLRLADELAAAARKSGAMFIVNDRLDIAMLAGADGVHVGQDDLAPAELRRVAPALTVGLSTHSLDQVRSAIAEPVEYLAIGPVFPTTTKVDADSAVGVTRVREAADLAAGRPLVAIGGITLATASAVLAAGAASVAIVSDLLRGDIAVRAREFVRACG